MDIHRLLGVVVIGMALTGCLSNKADLETDNPDGLEKPALSLAAEFEQLESLSALALDADNSQALFTDTVGLLQWLMAEANRHASHFFLQRSGASRWLKTGKLTEISPRKCAGEDETQRTTAIVWEDVNGDQRENLGDIWYILYNDCIEPDVDGLDVGITGTIAYHDTPALRELPEEDFDDILVQLDLQTESAAHQTALMFSAMAINHSRHGDAYQLRVLQGAKVGVKRGDSRFLFEFDQLTLGFDNATGRQTLNWQGRLFDGDRQGFIEVGGRQTLTFTETETVIAGGHWRFAGAAKATVDWTVGDDDLLHLALDADGDGGEDTGLDLSWGALKPAGFALVPLDSF